MSAPKTITTELPDGSTEILFRTPGRSEHDYYRIRLNRDVVAAIREQDEVLGVVVPKCPHGLPERLLGAPVKCPLCRIVKIE